MLPHRILLLLVALLTGASFNHAVSAATPVNHERLRIHTGLPKKAGDALFAYSPEWRIDGGEVYRITAMSFLNANKVDSNDPTSITKKLATVAKDGWIQLDPKLRGITLTQIEDKPALLISNKAGFSLTTVLFKDYTNQTLSYDLVDQSFSAAGVELAIDLVYAADVDYLDNFSSKKAQHAEHGSIEVVIDGHAPIVIKTDGKTTRELEHDIARQLNGAKTSETSLIPHIINKDKRNNKPFDGSEIQLSKLDAKRISISVDDPSLGVLTKFKYPDDNPSISMAEPRYMIFLATFLLLVGVFFVYRHRLKPT